MENLVITKIINEVIKPEARKEAINIMQLAEQKDIDDLKRYYKEKSFNVVCLVIDKAKSDLVKSGKLIQNEDDHFGNFPE
jgi:hypothetical protein